MGREDLMIFKQLNPGYCRTYLIGSEKASEVALIDPVLERVDDYLRLLDQNGWRLPLVIDTHTHADHISGGPALCDYTNATYAVHHLARPTCPTHRLRDEDSVTVGDIKIRCLHTPGHTNHCMTLVVGDRLLTGDFLFIGEAGAGRTDLPGGDPGEHFDSLQKLRTFGDHMLVLPAHDYSGHTQSTLGEERQSNPRLRFTSRDEYTQWLSELAQPTPEWMIGVVQANIACAQDPKAAWIPVDSPACLVGGSVTLGVDGQPVRSISPEDAKKDLAGALVLDVRDPEEYVGELGHIEGSALIPLKELPQRLDELESSRNKPVIAVCKTGARSHTAAGVLMQAGFTDVFSMSGGMTEWRALGYLAVH